MGRFQPATKRKSRARIALVGPSGSGKTYTALVLASGLGERIAVIDTERGSASKYASVVPFDALDLDVHSPQEYVQAIADAAREGYEVLVIDSLSHAWNGREGALEQVDRAASRSRSGNSFTAWRDVTPLHNQLVDAILRFPGHVIVTMRATTAYELQEGNGGKKTPVKIGMKPIQRDGIEYEFDIVADMDHSLTLTVSKTRCPELYDVQVQRPTHRLAETIRAWLDDGAEALPAKPIDTADPRRSSAPLATTAYGPEERERSAKQVAAGAKKGSVEVTLADGLIDHAIANISDIDTLREWIASNREAVIALSESARAYVLFGTSKRGTARGGGVFGHACRVIEGLNEGGFAEEWIDARATPSTEETAA